MGGRILDPSAIVAQVPLGTKMGRKSCEPSVKVSDMRSFEFFYFGVGPPAFTGRHEFEFFVLGFWFRRGRKIGIREKREGFADGGQAPEGLGGGV